MQLDDEISQDEELKTEEIYDWMKGKHKNDVELKTSSEIITCMLKEMMKLKWRMPMKK